MATAAPTVLDLFPARVKFVDQNGILTPEAYRALQSLLTRVGGPVSPSIPDLVIQEYADAGIEETKALLFAAQQGLSVSPVPVQIPASEPLQPPTPEFTQIEQLITEVMANREEIAVLRQQINDLRQGTSL